MATSGRKPGIEDERDIEYGGLPAQVLHSISDGLGRTVEEYDLGAGPGYRYYDYESISENNPLWDEPGGTYVSYTYPPPPPPPPVRQRSRFYHVPPPPEPQRYSPPVRFVSRGVGTDSIEGEPSGGAAHLPPEPPDVSPVSLKIFGHLAADREFSLLSLGDFYTPHYACDGITGGDKGVRGTFELGDGSGYTACLSADFDLLQLTAPSAAGCGVVFARGDFPDAPASILSRGQRAGFGFGMRIPEHEDYRWGDALGQAKNESKKARKKRLRTENGYLNYRWPITKEIVMDETKTPIADVITAWYAKGGTIFQCTKVSRRFVGSGRPAGNVEIEYKLGDKVRLGCCCTVDPMYQMSVVAEKSPHHVSLEVGGKVLVVEDEVMKGKLYVQCFQDGAPLDLGSVRPQERPDGCVDTALKGVVTLESDPIILVTTYSLRAEGGNSGVYLTVPPKLEEVEEELGIAEAGDHNQWGLLWATIRKNFCDGGNDHPMLRERVVDAIARPAEVLLSVAAFPSLNSDKRLVSVPPPPIALVSNPITTMTVDLQTCLWQVRLLVKVLILIRNNPNKRGEKYCNRIIAVLQGVVRWMKDCTHELKGKRPSHDARESHPRSYFVNGETGTTLRDCKRRNYFDQRQMELFKHPKLCNTAAVCTVPVGPEEGYTDWTLYRTAIVLYIWIHDSAIVNGLEKKGVNLDTFHMTDGGAFLLAPYDESYYTFSHLFLRWAAACFLSWRKGDDRMAVQNMMKTYERMRVFRKAEISRRIREGITDSYAKSQEVNDRIALLIPEIAAALQPNSTPEELWLVRDVKALLDKRAQTKRLRAPFPINFKRTTKFVRTAIKDASFSTGETTWSPWELSCNNHVIVLQSLFFYPYMGGPRVSEKARMGLFWDGFRKLAEFTQNGFSFVSSWDYSLPSAIPDWWSLETDSSLGGTLTHFLMYELYKLKDARGELRTESPTPDYDTWYTAVGSGRPRTPSRGYSVDSNIYQAEPFSSAHPPTRSRSSSSRDRPPMAFTSGGIRRAGTSYVETELDEGPYYRRAESFPSRSRSRSAPRRRDSHAHEGPRFPIARTSSSNTGNSPPQNQIKTPQDRHPSRDPSYVRPAPILRATRVHGHYTSPHVVDRAIPSLYGPSNRDISPGKAPPGRVLESEPVELAVGNSNHVRHIPALPSQTPTGHRGRTLARAISPPARSTSSPARITYRASSQSKTQASEADRVHMQISSRQNLDEDTQATPFGGGAAGDPHNYGDPNQADARNFAPQQSYRDSNQSRTPTPVFLQFRNDYLHIERKIPLEELGYYWPIPSNHASLPPPPDSENLETAIGPPARPPNLEGATPQRLGERTMLVMGDYTRVPEGPPIVSYQSEYGALRARTDDRRAPSPVLPMGSFTYLSHKASYKALRDSSGLPSNSVQAADYMNGVAQGGLLPLDAPPSRPISSTGAEYNPSEDMGQKPSNQLVRFKPPSSNDIRSISPVRSRRGSILYDETRSRSRSRSHRSGSRHQRSQNEPSISVLPAKTRMRAPEFTKSKDDLGFRARHGPPGVKPQSSSVSGRTGSVVHVYHDTYGDSESLEHSRRHQRSQSRRGYSYSSLRTPSSLYDSDSSDESVVDKYAPPSSLGASTDIDDSHASTFHLPDYMIASIEDTPDLYKIETRNNILTSWGGVRRLELLRTEGDSEIRLADWTLEQVEEQLKKSNAKFRVIDYDFGNQLLAAYDQTMDTYFVARYFVDNRVDVGAKFRIIAIESYVEPVASIHKYLLHSDCVYVISSYLGNKSNFYDSPDSQDLSLSPSWKTSLSLSYHKLCEQSELNLIREKRKEGRFPPSDKGTTQSTDFSSEPSSFLVSTSACFCITGELGARTWTCSVLGQDLAKYSSESNSSSTKPQPGGDLPQNTALEDCSLLFKYFEYDSKACRCLFVQLLVGYMLYEISQSYDQIVARLDHILKLSDQDVMFEGVNLGNYGFDSIFLFRWAMQCLDRFEECIKEALREADVAKQRMEAYINEDFPIEEKWCSELHTFAASVVENQYLKHQGSLEHTLGTVVARTQKAKAYHDAIASGMNLVEARQVSQHGKVAAEQGRHIQILTMITITYLPLSLTTSIFGMDIMPKSTSFITLGIVLAVSLALTVIAVYNFHYISVSIENTRLSLLKRIHGTSKNPQDPGPSPMRMSYAPRDLDMTVNDKQPSTEALTETHGFGFRSWVYFFKFLLVYLPVAELEWFLRSITGRHPPRPPIIKDVTQRSGAIVRDAEKGRKGTEDDGGSNNELGKKLLDPQATAPPPGAPGSPAPSEWEAQLIEHREKCKQCCSQAQCHVWEKYIQEAMLKHERATSTTDTVSSTTTSTTGTKDPTVKSKAERRKSPQQARAYQAVRASSATSSLGNVRLRVWVKATGKGMLFLFRTLILPLSLALVVIVYVIALMFYGIASCVLNMGFDDKSKDVLMMREPGLAEHLKRWFEAPAIFMGLDKFSLSPSPGAPAARD